MGNIKWVLIAAICLIFGAAPGFTTSMCLLPLVLFIAAF